MDLVWFAMYLHIQRDIFSPQVVSLQTAAGSQKLGLNTQKETEHGEAWRRTVREWVFWGWQSRVGTVPRLELGLGS